MRYPVNWEIVKLSDICDIKIGKTPARKTPGFWKDGIYPWLSISDMNQGRMISNTKEKITEYAAKKTKINLLPQNTLLLSFKLSIGKVGITAIPMYTNEAIAALTNISKKATTEYLYWVLKSINLEEGIDRAAKGKTLNKKKLAEIEIPLPSLPEQKRIAAILDKADALRDKRKKSIAKLDELVQSVFLDMFGDPIMNPKGWDIVELKDILEFITSGSRGWAKYYSDIGDTFIRIQNLQNGQLNLNEIAFVNPPKSAEAKRTKVQSGDVLVSITADLGRVGVVPQSIGDAYVNQHIAILRVKEIQPNFLAFYLASSGGKAQFNRLNRQGVKAGLNFEDLRKLKILIPPISLQNEFVQFQDKLIQNSKKLLDSKLSIEMLFSSLQQRSFRGEL